VEKIKLGQEVKDKITEFSGIAESITEFIYGCRRVNVIPRELGKDGKPKEGSMFDEPQLEIIGEGILSEKKPSLKTIRQYGDRDFSPTKHN